MMTLARTSLLLLLMNLPARAQDLKAHPRLFLTPETLTTLQKRAKEGRPEWKALKARCDQNLLASVQWLDADAYPSGGGIGAGYQGDGYRVGVENLGLCYQVARSVDPARARLYGRKGAEVLSRMSVPADATNPRAPVPLHDSGYGIRNYGVGMAIGYDWLYDVLTVEERKSVYVALDLWIDSYEAKGFGHDHPQGNYFAGYYATKALAPLATEGDDPRAAASWKDWLERVHQQMVQPYYSKYLAGGGWPEGWTYGPLATLNMSWPILAAKTARGMDLLHDAKAPFLFPVEQASYLMHFTWPGRRTIDQRGMHHPGPAPAATSASLFVPLAGLLERFGDPSAPLFHRYAREVRALRGDTAEPWQEMLFWDSAAPEAETRALPRSYLAKGMQSVAMRSGWEDDAVWGSFTAGTYVGNPDSGEMDFDQGTLMISRGDRPLLCAAAPTLMRHSPGTQDGDAAEQDVYDDGFGDNDKNPALGNRTLENIFYVRARRYGQVSTVPDDALTHLGAFEDGGHYVLARGEQLEDMYRKPTGEHRPVRRWQRQVVYLRPSVFVVEDRTETLSPDVDQWLAFHLAGTPELVNGAQGTNRFVVHASEGARGVVTTVLPAGNVPTVVDVFHRKRVFRLEVRPGAKAIAQRWLTVLDATTDSASSPVAAAITGTDAIGVLLRGAVDRAVVFANGTAREISYPGGNGRTLHLVNGLTGKSRYLIAVTTTANGRTIRITQGGDRTASAAGVIEFEVSADGKVK